MSEFAEIVDPVLLIRVPRAFRPGLSAVALYEATRGVWRIGPRREGARFALAVYQGVIEEVYEVHHWQPALTAKYATRDLSPTLARGRWEFVGAVAPVAVRDRYRGKSVASYFTRGAQNPITYVNVPDVPLEHRGSRKHILDLLSAGAGPRVLTDLLEDAHVKVSPVSKIRPSGHEDTREWDVRRFCRECRPVGCDLAPLNEWWISEEYRGPTWDLLAECSVDGSPGFLLVEAKAHEGELNRDGKSPGDDRNEQSGRNHQVISDCLAASQEWYRASVDKGCTINTDSHYQLANRLSAAHAVASCGVPVVLLYLGFTGDTYFRPDYIRDDAHWQRVMGAYLEGVVPLWWPGSTTPHQSGGSVTMLIRSTAATSISV